MSEASVPLICFLVPSPGRWGKKHLTFRILNLPSTLPSHVARAALLQAFQYWSDVTPLTFQEVKTGWADIRLSFHGRQSLYCSNTFDGPGRHQFSVSTS